jgi:3-oxoadipate enol-lactonase
VLLHGLLMSGEMFATVEGAFGTHHRLIIPDLRGNGRSTALPGPYTAGQLAADVAELLAGMGVGAVDVLGYSQGGTVAQQLAHDRPDRVRRLVLAATFAYNTLSPRERLEGALLPWLLRTLGPKRLANLVVRPGAGGGPQMSAETRRWVRDMLGSADRRNAVAAARAMTAFDSRPWLREITCPTLVVAGTADRGVPPAHAHMLAEGIPGAELRFVAGAGHAMIWTHPQEFVAAVEDWLLTTPAHEKPPGNR